MKHLCSLTALKRDVDFYCKRFRARVIAVRTACASLSRILCIMIASFIETVTHSQNPFRTCHDAAPACFAFQDVEYRIRLFLYLII